MYISRGGDMVSTGMESAEEHVEGRATRLKKRLITIVGNSYDYALAA